MSERKLIILNRQAEQQPWGFRLQGGSDFKTPLSVQSCQPGSVSEASGLFPGDAVLRINNLPTDNISHDEAKQEILKSGNIVELMIERGGATIWRPQVTQLSNIKPHQPNTQQFHHDSEPVYTKTSLKHDHQESLNIGSSHNRSAAPYGSRRHGSGPEIVHAQFNSPKGLYSNKNAESVYQKAEQDLAHDGHQRDSDEVQHLGYSNPNTQSRCFRRLEHDLEYDGEGHSPSGQPYQPQTRAGAGPAGFRSVMAPTPNTQPAQQPATQLMRCGACDGTIIGVFVKVKGIPMHPGCLKCVRCGVNLKNVGYFFIENQLYCETHAKQATRPGYGGYTAEVQYK
ncbi:PDZ and LIM domain protein 3-like [Tubulanus polymorphus]|uniref:PDZ and LIM domain protein 3-like n=1 Tax=Tubulanus polymorphus TaxID=672921 RepID=UPI003DA6932D